RRLTFVEVPVAVPVIIAGLRVASVATINMVSIASLVGIGGLGQQILSEGFRRQHDAPIVIRIVLTVFLALVTDALLLLAQRLLTPWTRDGRRAGRVRGRTSSAQSGGGTWPSSPASARGSGTPLSGVARAVSPLAWSNTCTTRCWHCSSRSASRC